MKPISSTAKLKARHLARTFSAYSVMCHLIRRSRSYPYSWAVSAISLQRRRWRMIGKQGALYEY